MSFVDADGGDRETRDTSKIGRFGSMLNHPGLNVVRETCSLKKTLNNTRTMAVDPGVEESAAGQAHQFFA